MRAILFGSCLLLTAILGFVRCAVAEAEVTPYPGPSREVARALKPLIAQYGVDAVNLQGNLLRNSVGAGSLLEASCGISGFAEERGSRYLMFKLQTGIAYQDGAIPPAARLVRLWQDVLEPSLRPCKRFDVQADGIRLELSYWHADFTSRTDLVRAMHEGVAVAEEISFRILTQDIVDFAQERITAQDLLSRSQIRSGDVPLSLRLPTLPPPASP